LQRHVVGRDGFYPMVAVDEREVNAEWVGVQGLGGAALVQMEGKAGQFVREGCEAGGNGVTREKALAVERLLVERFGLAIENVEADVSHLGPMLECLPAHCQAPFACIGADLRNASRLEQRDQRE
jgi:hypothetical protein